MNNLKYYRKKAGKTQKEVADFLGLVQQSYGHYETGKRQIPAENLLKLADLYNVSIDDLVGRNPVDDAGAGRHIEEIPELVPEDEVMLPLVASLRCGSGSAGEPFSYIKPIPVPKSYTRRWGDNLKVIMAVGESMSPTIIPGDMLVCSPGEAWESGQVVSVNYDDTDMVKRIYATADGGIDLRSDNPKFETIHVSPEEIRDGSFHVLGRVLIPIPQAL